MRDSRCWQRTNQSRSRVRNHLLLLDEDDYVKFMDQIEQLDPILHNEIQELLSYSENSIEEIERLRYEVIDQLRIKYLRYQFFRELNDEDFVKRKLPETLIMENLKKSYEDSILDYEDTLKQSDRQESYLNTLKETNKQFYDKVKDTDKFEVLSRNEYKALKEKIKERKEAKAKLLKQGYPKLKNYVYL
jgi:hypothetical protein